MEKIKEIAKMIPVLPFLYRSIRNYKAKRNLKNKTTEDVFTEIYNSNKWRGKESISGKGSDIHQTKIIIAELKTLLKDFHISSMLDIPCGDFNWMKNVDLGSIDYLGADIVEKLILQNKGKYERNGISFFNLNLIQDILPKVDLIFCRDCLVHFSFKDIFLALNNVCNSKSEYFLTTTFISRKSNFDIMTGQWRTLNLELRPFSLPKPLKLIIEGCTEYNGDYKDKALGLWRIADIRASLTSPAHDLK